MYCTFQPSSGAEAEEISDTQQQPEQVHGEVQPKKTGSKKTKKVYFHTVSSTVI